MIEEQKNIPPQIEETNDEIDVMELIRKLLSGWKLILLYCGIAAVVGLVIGFSRPKEYTAGSKLAPEITDKRSGSLQSLAGMAGINLESMSTSDAVYPDLYPDIVSSTPFIVELFSVPVEFESHKETVKTDVYDYLKNYTRTAWWSKVISAPMKGLGFVMKKIRGEKEEVEGYASLNPQALTPEQQKIAKALSESISVAVDKKTQVISVSVTTQSAKVSFALCEEIISRLQEYVSNYRTEKSRQDVKYYERIFEEAKSAYFSAQQTYAKYVDANQGVVRQSVLIEQERLQNEMALAYQIYNSAAQQLQVVKAKVQQETPVFAVINPPTQPTKPSSTSKMMTLLVTVFLGACCACVWILWGRDWVAKFKAEGAAA